MAWAAREGIISIFGIFVLNGISFMLTDKSLPFSAEAMAGVVSITVAAVGIVSARGYLNDRKAWQHAGAPGVTVNYTAGSGSPPPSSPPPGASS